MKVCETMTNLILLFYDLNRSNNLAQPYDSFPDFNFDDLEDDECLSKFRFRNRDLALLAEFHNEVNELKLIISRCLIRLVRQISVPTDKDLSKPLILRLKMRFNGVYPFKCVRISP